MDKDVVSRTLAVGAAHQISSEVTKSFVQTVEVASDGVFDQLLYKMEDICYSFSGGTAPSRRESGEVSTGFDSGDSGAEEPAPLTPKKGPPPSVPPKKKPPALPPKGAKPTPPERGSIGKSGAPSPRAPPPEGADALPKVPSNITHMTKDRPQGPAQRRRPQRKPARRPMMEGNE